MAGFDASGWQNAFICRSPGGILKKADCPPIRIVKTHDVKTITSSSSNCSVYDFGQNMSGWLKITVRGEAGSEVVIRYSERFTVNDGINAENINRFSNTGRGHSDKYILAGKAEGESWHAIFTYHGFRYAEITVYGNAEILKAEAQQVHTDLASVGSFECGDDMLNKIHKASVLATLSNYHGIPTDCPHREQNGWTGDASLSCEQALMNFDMVSAYRKWLFDFADVQCPSGQLPGIIPSSSGGYNWGSGPAWDSALILISLAVYELKGDISIAAGMWENMELYMKYLGSMADGCLVEFGLGDWCPPDNARVPPVMLTDTAYYYADAAAMAKARRL
jgi:alpha-L-rhamnosidase